MSSGASVTFNDPRRFGVMDLVPRAQLAHYPALEAMGPEPLEPDFDGAALARACAGKRTPLKLALLDQHVVAGLGNIYASEALHRAGLSPRRRASTLATRSGAPAPSALRLAAAIKQVLQEAIERKARPSYRVSRFRVYDREGERCRTSALRGDDPALLAGGTVDVLLPGLSALNRDFVPGDPKDLAARPAAFALCATARRAEASAGRACPTSDCV